MYSVMSAAEKGAVMAVPEVAWCMAHITASGLPSFRHAHCRPAPASSALIAVCWKGSSLNGYSLAGATVQTGGRVDPSMPGGQATSCVQDLPSHSTRLAPCGRTATLSSARRRDLVAGASGSSGRSSLRLMTSPPAMDFRLSVIQLHCWLLAFRRARDAHTP